MMSHKVLILEDEPDLLHALLVRLDAAGFNCTTACNGREGMAKIWEWWPDVVITDLVMPDMDGYDMVRQLKAHERTATIPIIVLTAVSQQTLEKHVKELGVARVMRKPFDSEQLLLAVKEVLHVRSQEGGHGDG